MRTRIKAYKQTFKLAKCKLQIMFVLYHQTENRFPKLLFNSDENKCIQSHAELFLSKIVSLLYDLIDSINIAIILKTIKLENTIKLWRQKVFRPTKFKLVLIAKLSCAIGSDTLLRDLSILSTYRPNEQNSFAFGGIKTIVVHSLTSIRASICTLNFFSITD